MDGVPKVLSKHKHKVICTREVKVKLDRSCSNGDVESTFKLVVSNGVFTRSVLQFRTGQHVVLEGSIGYPGVDKRTC